MAQDSTAAASTLEAPRLSVAPINSLTAAPEQVSSPLHHGSLSSPLHRAGSIQLAALPGPALHGLSAPARLGGSPGRPSVPSLHSWAQDGAMRAGPSCSGDLRDRLAALFDRQCRHSRLHGDAQEDAIYAFIAHLKKRLDRTHMSSAGTLFTSAPLCRSAPLWGLRHDTTSPTVVAESTASAPGPNSETQSQAEPPIADSGAMQAHSPPAAPPSVVCSSDPDTPAVLHSPMPPERVALLDSLARHRDLPFTEVQDNASGHLYQLLSHLSDIRSLAQSLTDVSARGAAAASSDESIAGVYTSQRGLLESFQASDALVKQENRLESGTEATTIPSVPSTPQPNGKGRSPLMGSAASWSPQASSPRWRSGAQPQDVVQQILLDVDHAAVIGERVLREVKTQHGQLVVQLQVVSRDRLLWMHRHYAARELQRSAELCSQAARIDQASIHERRTQLVA